MKNKADGIFRKLIFFSRSIGETSTTESSGETLFGEVKEGRVFWGLFVLPFLVFFAPDVLIDG